MLILKAFINFNGIDEIWVANTLRQRPEDIGTDWYEYQIIKPEGYEDIPIYHSRKRGWKTLAIYVLEVLEDE